MTKPPAWPEADANAYSGDSGRAQVFETIKSDVTSKLDAWNRTSTSMFDGHTWYGAASNSANGWVGAHADQMTNLERQLTSGINFYKMTSASIENAKADIRHTCDAYQALIDDARKTAADKPATDHNQSELEKAVEDYIEAAFQANSDVVKAAAAKVKAGEVYERGTSERHPGPTVELLSSQTSPPPPAALLGGSGSAHTEGATGTSEMSPAGNLQGKGDSTTTGLPGDVPAAAAAFDGKGSAATAALPPGAGTTGPIGAPLGGASTSTTQAPVLPPAGVVTPSPSPAPPPAIPKTGTPPPVSVGSGSGSGGGGSIGAGSGGAGGPGAGGSSSGGSASPLSDAKTGDQKAEAGPGQDLAGQTPDDLARLAAPAAQPAVAPAAFSAPALSAPLAPPIDPASIASAAINHTSAAVPDGPGPPSGPGGGGSGGGGGPIPPGGGGGGGIAPPVNSMPAVPPMPLLPPATPPPAGPPPPPPPSPNVNPAANKPPDVLPAPIPVSAVRAERDAILAASAAGTMAAGGANAALTLARRIAAALNVGATDFGFFWITGLTADGTIVVANSYGLGYIPQGVNLPENVKLATADESIPMADRAKWATYPILAVQGWAQAHAQKLRAVIATETQFANFDPGAAKIVLQAEDIPDTGAMQGRSRLEVIAPGAAAHLAAVPDAGLNDLLPAAPADASAPEDRSAAMWFDMAVPLMSTTSDRGIVHMELMVQYADHAQELALYRAHTAADAALQRDSIADWVYWQHLSVLMSDAIDATARV